MFIVLLSKVNLCKLKLLSLTNKIGAISHVVGIIPGIYCSSDPINSIPCFKAIRINCSGCLFSLMSKSSALEKDNKVLFDGAVLVCSDIMRARHSFNIDFGFEHHALNLS